MKIRLLLLALLTFGMSLTIACGDLEEDCAPGDSNDAGDLCICTDASDLECDPDDEDENCTCGFPVSDENSGNNTDPNNSGNNTDPNNSGNNTEPEPDAYLFLLIEDTTAQTSGAYPGFDGDAVTLTKADGAVHYAAAVEDSNIVAGEDAINPDTMLGPPDDNCAADDTKFVALGGVGGYIILSFSTMDFDGRIENGDSITVHEIGKVSCPNNTYDDEPYATSVATSLIDAQTGNVKVISSDSLGEATIPVNGL